MSNAHFKIFIFKNVTFFTEMFAKFLQTIIERGRRLMEHDCNWKPKESEVMTFAYSQSLRDNK